ncbi:hypothetical protein ABK040_016413 [Willaertia magna]
MTTTSTSNNNNKEKKEEQEKKELVKSNVCLKVLIVFIGLIITFYLLFCYWAYHKMFSLSNEYHIEGILKSQNNSIYGFESYIQCPDWKFVGKEFTKKYAFTPEEIIQNNIIMENVTFHNRKTNDVNELLDLNGLYITNKLKNNTKKVIIIVHGFRMRLNHITTILPLLFMMREYLQDWKYNYLLIEQRNHGNSTKETNVSINGNAFATYGSKEYSDLLGAIDFLKEQKGMSQIGIYALSMGGATSLISLMKYYEEKQENINPDLKCIFLDSPVCSVNLTLYNSVHYLMKNEYISNFIFNGINLIGKLIRNKEKHGHFPPFLNDPYQTIQNFNFSDNNTTNNTTVNTINVHFDHSLSDILVPIKNSYLCSSLLDNKYINNNLKIKTSNYFGKSSDKSELSVLGNECKAHCVLMMDNDEAYKNRMINFFEQCMN